MEEVHWALKSAKIKTVLGVGAFGILERGVLKIKSAVARDELEEDAEAEYSSSFQESSSRAHPRSRQTGPSHDAKGPYCAFGEEQPREFPPGTIEHGSAPESSSANGADRRSCQPS